MAPVFGHPRQLKTNRLERNALSWRELIECQDGI
jgi:hypothetical protein